MPVIEPARLLKAETLAQRSSAVSFQYADIGQRCDDQLQAAQERSDQILAEAAAEVERLRQEAWQVGHATGALQAEAEFDARVEAEVQHRVRERLSHMVPALQSATQQLIDDREQILLQTTDARAPELPIDVEGKISAPLVVSPGSLFLGIVQPGQKVTKQIVVQGKKPFKIIGVQASDSCFEFKTGDTAKTVHLVPVTFTAGNQPGNVNYRIEIATDLGDDVKGELSAYAQINAPATASAR